ncbi:hypothetical protein [Streptomyces luteireticuli]|uniref:Uncharacterized protein n=1 Tax=Streptomyces luteireticuli TaxID=173858 RepID=A0ABN0Z069_9ACTN
MEQSGRRAVRERSHPTADVFGDLSSGTRHPLVALAMVLPVAAVLAVVFGGWDTAVAQASSVAGMLGR